jgi:5'-phosphate synthase pdxT subunit
MTTSEWSADATDAEDATQSPPRIGVLALQGDFREHLVVLRALGAVAHPVRLPADSEDVDGLVIPGGESTVMGKLMIAYGLDEPLRRLIAGGLPVWGTCAGLILLSRATDNALSGQPLLAAMDIRTRRNAFGAQRASFEADLAVPALGDPPFHAVFIRGPSVDAIGPGVEVLARLDDDHQTIVAVRQGSLLGTAFHPEVTGDSRFHAYFLDLVRAARAARAARVVLAAAV